MSNPPARSPPPDVVALQPLAVIDHSVVVDDAFLRSVDGEIGGSSRVGVEELERILERAGGAHRTRAGGSAANTARALATGFRVSCALLGAVGGDDWGAVFAREMRDAGVSVDHLTTKPGLSFTGRCACLVDAETGQRTMRASLQDAVRLTPEEVRPGSFVGVKWAIVNGYAFYGEGLADAAVDAAATAKCKVAMHLASFEVVRHHRDALMRLLRSGKIDAVFANEEEARELLPGEDDGGGGGGGGDGGGGDGDGVASRLDAPPSASVASRLDALASTCDIAVITLGDRGCVAARGAERVRVSAFGLMPCGSGVRGSRSVVDTTGAGDLFSAGFIYGLLRGESLHRCCERGNLCGAAVVGELGGEVSEKGWAWVRVRERERILLD